MKHYLRQYTDRFTEFSNKNISDLILYSCGIEYCESNHSYSLKSRDYHFIHFVKEGTGTLEIDGKEYHVSKNQMFIVPAGYAFKYTAASDDPWKYCWFGFLGIRSNFIYDVSKKQQYVVDCHSAVAYENIIRQILDTSDNSFSSFLKINGLMYTLLGNVVDEIGILNRMQQQSISTLAMHYMNLNYQNPIQITDVAEFIGVHPNYLTTAFHKERGESPKRYLTELRVRKAKELLVETGDPVNIIAASVGFDDSSAFSKFFKKETGIAPKLYRDQYC